VLVWYQLIFSSLFTIESAETKIRNKQKAKITKNAANSHLSLVATHILIASVLFATINDYNGIVHLYAFILFDLPHLFFQSGDGLLSGQAWGCDLSYDYVKINAEYTT
jgi:hypothetical protein